MRLVRKAVSSKVSTVPLIVKVVVTTCFQTPPGPAGGLGDRGKGGGEGGISEVLTNMACDASTGHAELSLAPKAQLLHSCTVGPVHPPAHAVEQATHEPELTWR